MICKFMKCVFQLGFILIVFMSCEDNFNKNSTVKNINQSFKQMEFIDLELSEVSERAILNLKNETHDKHFLDPSSNKLISVDSIILLLNYYKQIDRFTKKNSMTFWWRNRIVWQYRDTTSLLKIERLEIRDTKDSNLSIIDYNIFIQGQFDNISLRFLNKSEIVKVYYNIREIVKLKESVPLGYHNLIEKMDSINTRVITCR